MAFSLKKIHHLIRYFVLLGIVIFVGYVKRWQDPLFLLLIGPALYLAYTLKQAVISLISLPPSEMINYYAFLMPVCLLYFGLLGFQLKQLWNERGKIRFVSLFALIVFVIYIHYSAWGNLSSYFFIPDPPALPASTNLRPIANGPLGDNQGQALKV